MASRVSKNAGTWPIEASLPGCAAFISFTGLPISLKLLSAYRGSLDMKKTVFRTQYIIYPRFQMALLGANLIAWLTFVVTMIGLILASNSEMRELGESAGLPTDHVYFRFLEMQVATFATKLLAGAVFALFISSVFFVWYSHRLVGPLHNLRSYLARVLEAKRAGEPLPGPVRFRANDYFQDLTDGVNAVLQEEQGDGRKSEPKRSA